jgi:flavin-dependent dehydrogenase
MTPSYAKPLRVAVLGAGPSGCALAVFLRRQGAEVTLFDDERRPPVVVGESLIPAVVPILAALGVEERTAALGALKPGASILWSPDIRFRFLFSRFAPAMPAYAYNVPRPAFDDLLRQAAVEAGARRVNVHARLEPGPGGDGPELRLHPDALAAAPWLNGHPDLVVDASGRARHGAVALGIGARLGPRRDVAHFAHFEGFTWPADEPAGQVLLSRLEAGWSWRIPLPGRLSTGIVLGREDAERLGSTPEARLETAIARDPWLRPTLEGARRVTPVATYANYQLISERGYGRGWVAVGDAFGFVDPMLSPGVLLALRSAERVAAALAPLVPPAAAARREAFRRDPTPALEPCVQAFRRELEAWMELVAHLYEGRLAALMQAGAEFARANDNPLARALNRHIDRQVALQASGLRTTSRYARGLLRFLSRHATRGIDPAALVIR